MTVLFRGVRGARNALKRVMPLALYDLVRGLWRRARLLLPAVFAARAYPGVPGRIHNEDYMLASPAQDDLQRYVAVGLSAMANIAAALHAGGRDWADVTACLDFACGYGRVLRWLAQRIPPGQITACDVDRQAVRFCAAEFGAEPLFSLADFRAVTFPRRYDLILVGSLFTHLPIARGRDLLAVLAETTAPAGLLIFTTQGESCLDRLASYGPEFAGLEPAFREGVAGDGAYFAPYRGGEGMGIAIHRRDHLRQYVQAQFAPSLRLVHFVPAGWDDHQDVWAWQRIA